MANPARQLVNRWRFGANLPEKWDDARRELDRKLKDLERTLGILHGAVEYPAVSYPTRIVSTADTTINSGTFTDLTGATSTTFTIDVDSNIWVQLLFYVQCATFGAASDTFVGGLAVNGAPFGATSVIGFTSASDTRMTTRIVQDTVKSGTSIQFKLQGKQSGSSTYTALTGCAIHYMIIPNAYKVP